LKRIHTAEVVGSSPAAPTASSAHCCSSPGAMNSWTSASEFETSSVFRPPVFESAPNRGVGAGDSMELINASSRSRPPRRLGKQVPVAVLGESAGV